MKNYLLQKIKSDLACELNKLLNQELVKPDDFVYPPTHNLGDLSLACFNLARELKESPHELAQKLLEKLSSCSLLKKKKALIASFKIAGPYLNFVLNKKNLTENIFQTIQKEKEKYGQNFSGKKARVMIEHSQFNTHKECHVGHLRNLCYGDSIYRLLKTNGYTAIPFCYINDFGIHVAKTIWAYSLFYKNSAKAQAVKNKGELLGQIYARAGKEIEKDKTAKETIAFIMKKIEMRQGLEYEIWEQTRQWSLDEFQKIFQELKVEFKDTWYENEFFDEGMKKVQEMLDKNILTRSQGAVIADLEKYKLGVLVFLRSNGSALYPVADIPLSLKKFKKYKLDQSIVVVDIRQGLYFEQLSQILKLLGQEEKITHLGYEFVKLPSGMMASRTGNIISYQQLKRAVMKAARAEILARHKNWGKEKVEKTAWMLTVSALKFEMLKVSPNQIITFDIKNALKFQGFTAAYLQYTAARLQSILRQSENSEEILEVNYALLNNSKETELILKLAKYPEKVLEAGKNYDPSEIARYIFELCQMINDYYHAVPILKSEVNLKLARLALIQNCVQIIKNGLNILGIEMVDKM